MSRMRFRLPSAMLLLAIVGMSSLCHAQSDEIQVYDGGLAQPGVFNLTWHNNYTFKGSTVPPAPGGIAPQHSLNGVTEWAYGVNSWFEAGLYLPLYTMGSGKAQINGFKLRALVARPDAAEHRFVYGLGFELSFNARHWDTTSITSEIRPIIGWHLGKVDVIINPILDTAYDGLGDMVFAPSMRLAYNVSPRFAVALEEYADFGPLRNFASGSEQSHQLFAVTNYAGKYIEVEAGLGVGLTSAADDLVFKLILARDLN
ncbi:MAG: hypothetical protein ABI616_10455 [Pseudomonadota bacterium]